MIILPLTPSVLKLGLSHHQSSKNDVKITNIPLSLSTIHHHIFLKTAHNVFIVMVNVLSAWCQGQIPSLYIRQGPLACLVGYLAVLLWLPALKGPMLIWLGVELLWMAYFSYFLLPQLTNFRPEDSCKPLDAGEVNRLIDNICFSCARIATPSGSTSPEKLARRDTFLLLQRAVL